MARSGVVALVLMVTGAVLLAAAEPMTLRSVSVGGRVVGTQSAGAHHGWALAALVGAVVALASAGGKRRH